MGKHRRRRPRPLCGLSTVDCRLAGRPTLRRVFLLVDARHGVKAVDGEIMALLDRSAVTFQAVLDQGGQAWGKAALEATVAGLGEALGKHPAAFPEVIGDLGETGDGLGALRAVVADMV